MSVNFSQLYKSLVIRKTLFPVLHLFFRKLTFDQLDKCDALLAVFSKSQTHVPCKFMEYMLFSFT